MPGTHPPAQPIATAITTTVGGDCAVDQLFFSFSFLTQTVALSPSPCSYSNAGTWSLLPYTDESLESELSGS